jgi:peptidoglycan L-alanyl-D-glutamate endopeptidase CwlK
MATLRSSVGKGGKNFYRDALLVQKLLKANGSNPGALDGICGHKTISAIIRFQRYFLKKPDGLVEPDYITWRNLTGQSRILNLTGETKTTSSPTTGQPTRLTSNSSQWTQAEKLASLNQNFKIKIIILLQNLKNLGYSPTIVYGWRSVAVQRQLYQQGKTKVLFSFHNAQTTDGRANSYAADIVDSRYGWSNQKETMNYWQVQGKEAKRLGLYWGGDWKTIWDPAHVQYLPNSKLGAVKRESGL